MPNFWTPDKSKAKIFLWWTKTRRCRFICREMHFLEIQLSNQCKNYSYHLIMKIHESIIQPNFHSYIILGHLNVILGSSWAGVN